jgi:YVTN family beta-propeller protein
MLASPQLPTGVRLEPTGRVIDVGNMPLSMTLTPERDRAVVVLSGWRQQGFQIVDLATGAITQTVPLDAAFIGAAFSQDGKTLYISGGNDDVVHVYSWADRQATLVRDINLKLTDKDAKGSRYPAGIALSNDGQFLYVAENVGDDLAVIDVASMTIVKRLKTDRYPYHVVVSKNGDVFVSAWGADTISVFRDNADFAKIEAGRHPSALRLNAAGTRLYAALASVDQIAIIDTKSMKRIGTLDASTPAGTKEGSTPNALAFSRDEKRLYVAEADNNAVAVFDLAARKRLGRIPVQWYPSDLIVENDQLFVLNAKGRGTIPNPKASHPGTPVSRNPESYTLALIKGTISVVDLESATSQLAALTKRVSTVNHWQRETRSRRYPPFKHVIYIIKENRTYDQVFGGRKDGDGDPSLLFFGPEIAPNHYALADRFGLYDRFFTSGEVSSLGHVWLTAAYVTDYGEKIVPSAYASKRPDVDERDADEPSAGYLWTRAKEKGITLRNYGEFGDPEKKADGYKTLKKELDPYTSPDYPPFDMTISDQHRADVWMKEFAHYVETKSLPALQILHLPNDHTAGARANRPTPRAYMADNDFALARIVSAVSKSRYWRDTIIFVIEDDAQDGPDHVDSHRSVMFTISAYNRPGLQHRFTNTTDVVGSIEEILGLKPMSPFDTFARPLADVFVATADLTPYEPILPNVDMKELNPPNTAAAKKSAALDLVTPDASNEDDFNRILWAAVKGEDVPYPGATRASTLMWMFGGQ